MLHLEAIYFPWQYRETMTMNITFGTLTSLLSKLWYEMSCVYYNFGECGKIHEFDPFQALFFSPTLPWKLWLHLRSECYDIIMLFKKNSCNALV
jgi:hypothetical protein